MNQMATKNCIVYGKIATVHCGHVIGKQKMALGNYINIKICAGFCKDHHKVINNVGQCFDENNRPFNSDNNGCYGTYDHTATGLRPLFI